MVLIGDALAGFRPHTVASTRFWVLFLSHWLLAFSVGSMTLTYFLLLAFGQAAFGAMVLADMVEGKASRDEWEKGTTEFATLMRARGVEMGQRSQHDGLPLEEHVRDRNAASRPREGEILVGWVAA